MEVYWTLKAQDDLERIYRFALQYSRQHADDVLDRLITGCAGLTAHPANGLQQTRLNLGRSEQCYSLTMRFITNSLLAPFEQQIGVNAIFKRKF